jgi:hypothetical protein
MKMILDIPDAAVLKAASLDDMVDTYCRRLKVQKPDVICLPLVDYGGANYDSDYIDKNVGYWALKDFAAICRQVKEEHGSELYLSVNAGLPFIQSTPFIVRDQYNDDKSGACIVNPGIQQLHRKLLEEAIALFEPSGILFDLSDINGQAAVGGRLFVTCFCQHCLSEMKRVRNFDPRIFRSHPNPLNLVLKATETGIRNFEIDSRIRSPKELIELSKSNDVYEEELCGANAERWADAIIDYVETRCIVTANALRSIVQEIRDKGIKVACTICSPRFDWTSGIDLGHLSNIIDEAWLETNDLTAQEITTSGLNVHHLLFSKGRYTVDALFEIVSSRDRLTSIARGLTSANRKIDEIIEDRIRKVVGASQFLLSNKIAIELQGACQGVVGIPLTEELAREIGRGAQRIVDGAIKNPLLPSSAGPAEEEKKEMAMAVLASLSHWLQEGRPITMEVLNAVAQQVGE